MSRKLTLSDYKRPPGDNGRGLHGPATSRWPEGQQGLDYWIQELVSLGCRWFRVLDDRGDSLPLCQKLLAAGIFPVVRILRRDPAPNDSPQPNPGHVNAAEEETIKKLVDIGVLYFETNDEPNVAGEWKDGAMPADPEEAARLVALNWLFDARVILDAGGYPGLPAIGRGSEMDLLKALAELGREEILLEGCWLAIHNLPLNRPLDYPEDPVNQLGAPLPPPQYDRGPLTAWTWWDRQLGRPHTPDELNQLRAARKNPAARIQQDRSCFREYEYFYSLAQKYLGRPIPMIATKCGYMVGRRDDARYPRVTPQAHAELTVALFDWMQRQAPDYFFASLAWLLLPSPGFQEDAWYSDFWQVTFDKGPRLRQDFPPFPVPKANVGLRLPVIAAVKAMSSRPRGLAGIPASSAPSRPVVEISTPAKPPPPRGRPPVPGPAETTYILQPGDTLATVASRFNTTVSAIVAANFLPDASRITSGQRIVIPIPPGMTYALRADRPAHPPAKGLAQVPPAAPPRPQGVSQFDPRLAALGIQVLGAIVVPGVEYWKLVRATYLTPDECDDGSTIQVALLDEQGAAAADQPVLIATPDDTTILVTDVSGRAGAVMEGSFQPERKDAGAYSAWVDQLPSDRVTGMGRPRGQPVCFRLTWQKTRK